MDLFQLTPSGLQHQGSTLKGTSGIWGGTEVLASGARAGGQLLPGQNSVMTIVPFLSSLHTEPLCSGTLSETPSTWFRQLAPP